MRKTHPSIYLATLKKLRVRANRCLHVGDDPIADVQGAKGVGMKTAFVKKRDKEEDADIIIEKLSDLLDFIPATL
ncbi:MAG: HAD family hydrolase [Candidatus Heimdallarchaeota archaeon]